jgi:biopolymer transport protein TolR
MVTTPMIHNAIKVNLPHGRVKEDSGATQDLVVYIDKEEKIYINGVIIKPDRFVTELKKIVGREQDKMVYVKADRAVSYGFVTETVDQMKRIEGIAHVALATQRA